MAERPLREGRVTQSPTGSAFMNAPQGNHIYISRCLHTDTGGTYRANSKFGNHNDTNSEHLRRRHRKFQRYAQWKCRTDR